MKIGSLIISLLFASQGAFAACGTLGYDGERYTLSLRGSTVLTLEPAGENPGLITRQLAQYYHQGLDVCVDELPNRYFTNLTNVSKVEVQQYHPLPPPQAPAAPHYSNPDLSGGSGATY